MQIAVIGAGSMGAKVAHRMFSLGCGPILTNLDGRSAATVERAKQSGMIHASYSEIVEKSDIIISIVPPKDAAFVAEQVVKTGTKLDHRVVFADCNAVNPDSVREISSQFEGTGIVFLDGSIIGLPPSETYNPGFYFSTDASSSSALEDAITILTKYGINCISLTGEGSGIGDASALKMAHAAVVKGSLGLFTTAILAAHSSSPSTAKGLVHALNNSQPKFIELMNSLLPGMFSRSYRMVRELEEVAGFVGGNEAAIFEGISKVFGRVTSAQVGAEENDGGDVDVIQQFLKESTKSVHTRQQ